MTKKIKRKIAVVTGTRAEYGLLYWLMKEIKKDPTFTLQLIVTGSHLSKDFGNTSDVIEKDGFVINKRIPILKNDDSVQVVTKSMAKAISGFAEAFEELKPQLLILLGDRYETFAAAQAALLAKIPVAHIAGGDSTEGAFDEALRHSISKMAHLHFVTNDLAVKRVRQLGENPKHIFNTGSTGLDQIKYLSFTGLEELQKKIGFEFRTKNLLITFHPSTLEKESAKDQFAQLLAALDGFGEDTGLIFTKPNADPGGRVLIEMLERFAKKHSNAVVHASLGQTLYLNTMRYVDAVVGNSSSGIYEAPSFKIPTVDIGDRQKGRLFAPSVIHCEPKAKSIQSAIKKAFSLDCSKVKNPYGKGNSSEKIFKIIKEIPDWSLLLSKHFFDYKDEIHPISKGVYVIAEAGVNHNGSFGLAKKLIDKAVEAGADAVKFQVFKASNLVCENADKAPYQKKTTKSSETQFEMLKKLELNENDFQNLADYAKSKQIDFLATPFDEESLDFLVNVIGVKCIKVPSGEITNTPFLLKIARKRLPLIISTGMATLSEIEQALGIVAFGFINDSENPNIKAFQDALKSEAGHFALSQNVILLHATTDYPTSFENVNLKAMDTVREKFGLKTGLSDHSIGISASLAAVARGAVVIEKHFTLDKSMEGPDHTASLNPGELKDLVRMIREIEESFGSSEKRPTKNEAENIPVVRKSVVAKKLIRKNEKFTEENLTTKRPGKGISPDRYWNLLGKSAKRDFKKDEMVFV